MANDLNRVILVGRLTRDPELKATSNGSYFCRFSLASNRSYTKNGEQVENVGFFECVAWGKLAEIISKYVKKGRRIGIDGTLRFSRWEGQDGQNRSKVEIYVDNFQFLDAKGVSDGESQSYDNSASINQTNQNEGSSNPSNEIQMGANSSMGDEMDDDMPF